MNAAPVKNVVFDLGGVLLEWNPAKILADFYPDPERRRLLKESLFGHADWLALDRGTLNEAQVLERAEQRTGRPAAELAALHAAMRESLHAKPDTVALLDRLHARGIPLYCLSNMSAAVYSHLRLRHDFWDRFRGIVISGEIQLLKPEPEIFTHLLERFGLEARETVFIDDIPANVEGARGVGMHAIQFTDAADCERQLQPLLGLA
jgi:HAD superfamily hydrolase (TIGR01509 family)